MPEHNSPTDPHTPTAVVTDPDDFNRQQRFSEIHTARQRVADYIADYENKIFDKYDHNPGKVPALLMEQLAFHVSLYVMELIPLLKKKGGDDPYMSEKFNDYNNVDDLHQFAFHSGMLRDKPDETGKPIPQAVTMNTSLRVFQVANLAYSELGMDLDVAESKGDAGFDYSDILEEGPPGGDAPKIEADGSGNERGSAE